MTLTKRDLWAMAGLTLITFGLYCLYWAIKTKDELNKIGSDIPTGLLLFIPFANFYFWYKYAQGFASTIKNNADSTVAYFLLMVLVPFIGMFIIQADLNKYADLH